MTGHNVYHICWFSLVILISVINIGSCLQCYKCDVNKNTNDTDPCTDHRLLANCTASEVCISAAYLYQGNSFVQYTTYKNCTAPIKDACQVFLENQKKKFPPGKLDFIHKCYTCNETGCNKDSLHPPPAPTGAPSKSFTVTLTFILMVPALLLLGFI